MMFLEKGNVYVREHGLQSVLYFIVCALISVIPFILCLFVGGFFEILMIILIVVYVIGRIALIVLACLFASTENFISIPGLKQLIENFSNWFNFWWSSFFLDLLIYLCGYGYVNNCSVVMWSDRSVSFWIRWNDTQSIRDFLNETIMKTFKKDIKKSNNTFSIFIIQNYWINA